MWHGEVKIFIVLGLLLSFTPNGFSVILENFFETRENQTEQSVPQNEEESVTVLYSVISALGWFDFVIFADRITVNYSFALSRRLSNDGRMGSVLQVDYSDAIINLFDHRLHHRNFLLYCGSEATETTLQSVSTKILLPIFHFWIIMLLDNQMIESNSPKRLKFSCEYCNIIFISRKAQKFHIYLKVGTDPVEVGSWSQLIDGLNVSTSFSVGKPQIKANVTVALRDDPPYVMLKRTSQGLEIKGLDVDVANLVAEYLNIRYEFIEIAGGYGEKVSGTWTGLFGALQRKEADFILPTVSPTILRLMAADISAPISNSYSRFLICRPIKMVNYKTYIEPFSTVVWAFLLVSFVFSIAGLTASALFSPFRPRSVDQRPIKLSPVAEFFEASFTCWSCVSERGPEHFPEVLSSRVVVTTFLVTCLLVMHHYNSVLFAVLTVDDGILPFDSVESVVENNQYEVGFVKGSAYGERLTDHKSVASGGKPDSPFQRLYDKVMSNPNNLVKSNQEGMVKACREKFAFLSWEDGILYELNGDSSFDRQKNCSYVFTNGKFLKSYYGIAFTKGSPFTEAYTKVIIKLRESGVLQRLHDKYFPSLNAFTVSPPNVNNFIGVQQVLSLLLILAVGIGLSLTVLMIEVYYYKFRRDPSKNCPHTATFVPYFYEYN